MAKLNTIISNMEKRFGIMPKEETSKELIYVFEDIPWFEDDKGRFLPMYIHIKEDVAYATWNRRKIKSFSSEEDLFLFVEEECLDFFDSNPEDILEEYPWEKMEERRQYWF